MRAMTIATVAALCALSAYLGFRAGQTPTPDPSGIVAAWAETYQDETGRAGPCAGRPEGTGYVIICGEGQARVTYRTDALGRLLRRDVGGREG